MSDGATAARANPASPRMVLAAVIAGLVVGVVVIGWSVAPYIFKAGTLKSEIAKQVRATTGLILSADGEATFGLLPEPHVSLHRLRFTDPAGTIAMDADTLDGTVRLLPLLVGRLEMSSATLYKAKLAIDLDGQPMSADSTIGRALHADEAANAGPGQRLGTVILVDGTASVKSKSFAHPLAFDAVDVTLDWRALASPATLTGTMKIDNTAADVAAWIAQPSGLMRGDHSAVTLRLRSTPIDLTANGDLTSAVTSAFRGHVSATMPSVPGMLALAGYRLPFPAPFSNVALNADLTLSRDADGLTMADLPNLRLRLDGNDYEGTLAFQDGAKPLLSGTLAADQLVLTPFLYRAPPLIDAERRWARTPVAFDHIGALAVDLRVSAANLRLLPFTVNDAALSVMTREDRTEVGLVEGKAYGGSVRGRISFGATSSGLNIRAAGSLKDADVSALSWDAFGRQLATGAFSGALNLETTGTSTATFVEHLQGWAKANAKDGEISGLDLGSGLRDVTRQRYDLAASALQTGRTPFATLDVNLRLGDGIAVFEQANIEGQDARMEVTGKADLGQRLLNLRGLATPPVGVGSSKAAAPTLSFDVSGSFDQVTVKPVRSPTGNGAMPSKP